MSGFGIRALKKVTTEDENSKKSQFVKHLVYGNNSYAIMTFIYLNRKYPGEVKLFSKNPLLKDDLIKEWNCSINTLRNENSKDLLSQISAKYEVLETDTVPRFYKDTKLQPFGGRAKPHKLLTGEEYFSQKEYDFKAEAFFSEEEWNALDEIINEHAFHKYILEILIKTPEDLVEKKNFELKTGEFESFTCEKLYFTDSPKEFLSLVKNKNDLDDEVQAYCAGIEAHQGIVTHITCKKEISKEVGTFVIPQSMTHEWGSFIVELADYNPETNSQELCVLSFVGENDIQEDDLAKKIKLMRRVVERVFPELSECESDQNIRFDEGFAFTGINDELASKLKTKDVLFTSHAGALAHENSSNIQYFVRGLKTITDL